MSKKLLQAAAGAGGEALYVEDVFSTYLYTGTGADQTITNGINLSEEGGLVWLKDRGPTYTGSHSLFDTERGGGYVIESDTTDAQLDIAPYGGGVTFNTDGFVVKSNYNNYNRSGENIASWTFRKAPKFFDVVTYTGNGSVPRSIAHNLGSVPGFIAIKLTSGADNWICRHRSAGDTPNDMTNYTTNSRLFLNLTNAASGSPNIKADASTFTVNHVGDLNTNGATYVAYLFAHDAGGFGDDGSESIIKCGVASYPVSGDVEVNLGFEPQWVLLKDAKHSGQPWWIIDTMRGWSAQKTGGTLSSSTGGNWQALFAESSSAESSYSYGGLTSTGFKLPSNNNYGDGNTDYIYIAIRRPMKTPESGTEVFAIDSWSSGEPNWTSSFPVDFGMIKSTASSTWNQLDRLRGEKGLRSNSTAAETSETWTAFDNQDGFGNLGGDSSYYSWMFKRATGFFDVVAYTGDFTNPRTISHNLGVAPELIITKRRTAADNWLVGANFNASNYDLLTLETTNSANNLAYTFRYKSQPTSTSYTVDQDNSINGTGETYIAYLFATLAGVSKVGSYTGTGSNVDVDCGFSAGARFILIKRTDSTGDWYVWDSARGIVAGNDPYLLLNSTAAEVTSTDYIDPLSSGFTVTSSAPAALNASGGTYIFLAVS